MHRGATRVFKLPDKKASSLRTLRSPHLRVTQPKSSEADRCAGTCRALLLEPRPAHRDRAEQPL